MIIDIDLGNTRVKWRYSHEPETVYFLEPGEAVPIAWERLPQPSRIRVSSVVAAEKTAAFVAAVNAHCRASVEIAAVKSPFAGVSVAYADASRLGVDRWLALLAAHRSFPGRDCVVLHGGTAVVVDFLRADGCHLGGYIAPGLRSAISALGGSAPGLGLRDSESVSRRDDPGATTLECIQAGYTALYRGLLQQIATCAAVTLAAPHWLFAGGDGAFFAGLWRDVRTDTTAEPLVVPGLVMDGLAVALP